MLSMEDLKELGVPMGPRKKLAELISREKERVNRVQVCVCVCKGGLHEGMCSVMYTVWMMSLFSTTVSCSYCHFNI